MGTVVFSGHVGFETNTDPPTADEASQVAAFDDLQSGYKRIYCDYSPDLATWARQRSYIV